MTELPNADYRFPPIVKPIEHELHRIEAAAHLAMWQCPHCTTKLEALGQDGTLPKALGITHEEGCPDWAD
jgi:hypothetical protein